MYKAYLGDFADGLPASGLRFPLSIKNDDGKFLIRTLLAVDEEEQSLTFAGDVPEGVTMLLMRGNADRLIQVAINISGLQFADAGFIESIDQALVDSGMHTRYLELEITESTIMRTDKVVHDNIRKLKDRGLVLSIDDFGTGYSSLSVIKQFPIDSLKIDQSFVRDIVDDSDDEAIVTAIIAFARSLKLRVIAEGVETSEQFECLVNKGCDVIQGYWVSRPLDPQAVEDLLLRDPDYFIDDANKQLQAQ